MTIDDDERDGGEEEAQTSNFLVFIEAKREQLTIEKTRPFSRMEQFYGIT